MKKKKKQANKPTKFQQQYIFVRFIISDVRFIFFWQNKNKNDAANYLVDIISKRLSQSY